MSGHMAVMDVACGRLQLRCGQAFSELAHGGFLVQEVCNLKQTHLLGAWCFSVSSFLMAGMDVYLYVCRLISLPSLVVVIISKHALKSACKLIHMLDSFMCTDTLQPVRERS